MTEEEAKQKQCPFKAGRQFNSGEAGQRFYCIGSECMAWRYKGVSSDYRAKSYQPGYCGLAGKS